jgi:hypothetical protein
MTVPTRPRLFAWISLCAALALAACAAAPAFAPGAPQRIAFIDSDGFDRQLQGAVGARAEVVEIAMLAPASVNSLPPRLGKVLSTVQDAGGKVTLQSATPGEPVGKSLSLLGLLPALVDAVQDLRQRQAFRDYDAKVTVADGQVTRVELTKAR